MEKQYIVLYQSYTGTARPTNLPQAVRYNFYAHGTALPVQSFKTEEEAINAIKEVNPANAFGAGYSVVWTVAQLIMEVATKPVIETVVTRY